jgi:hypothetical protein
METNCIKFKYNSAQIQKASRNAGLAFMRIFGAP